MIHPVICNPVVSPVVLITDPVAWRAGGGGYPASLALLYNALERHLKSLHGPNPVFTGTPTLSAGGVIPGDGPSFTDVVTWSEGGTLVVEFTATTASADLVGDVQVFGPVYACSTGLKAKDGTNEATVATSWGVGDVVTAMVQADGDVMRCGRVS